VAMARLGLSLCCLAAALWTAPALAQGGDEADEGEDGEASEMGAGTDLTPRDVPLNEDDDALAADEDDDALDEETGKPGSASKKPADKGLDGEAEPLAEAPVDDDEPPFFGVSLGAKGTVGGNLWTEPETIPAGALIFADTAGGWGGGGGLYTELRALWGYLGLEVDLLFERNSSWHNVTINRVFEADWILKWTALRVPILVKAILPTSGVRISLGAGPEIVAGLDAETELVVKRGEDVVPASEIEAQRNLFVTEAQTDTYFTTDLGLAFEVWQLAITLDFRAGFNLSQPSAHDDRIEYTFGGTPAAPVVERMNIIASNSMDFRMLLGVAWETGFGF